MWGLLIALVIGLAYGYMAPGRQDKSRLFWKGLLFGIITALVLAVIGWFSDINPLGLGDSSFFGIVLSFVILTVAFLVGIWVGDMFEHRRHTGLRRV